MQQNPIQNFAIKLLQAAALPGYLQGLAQPCARVLLHFYTMSEKSESNVKCFDDSSLIPLPAERMARLSKEIADNKTLCKQAKDVLTGLESINNLLVRMQESAGCPVCSGMVIEHMRRSKTLLSDWSVLVILPSLNPAALLKVLPFVLAQVTGQSKPTSPNNSPETLDTALALLSSIAPRGMNTRQFLAEAYQQDVPVQHLSGQMLQYGWASRSRWMDSSFTDAASAISARLARDKVATNNLLRRAGLPVAKQVRVATEEMALQQAELIGYPVVIKPANLDGGKGVEAGLLNPASLVLAFKRALTFSKNLILEQHINGKDYRLSVVNGRLVGATHREPAGVWGDGVSGIEQLIDHVNLEPQRGKAPWCILAPLVINTEAKELLLEQAVTLSSIPDLGCFISLRRSANVTSGGRPVDNFEQAHPDNAALAEQVARLFRLDIVGIDFICPDISRSWHEVGGAVCEVNGQPQFTSTRAAIIPQIIAGLVKGRGRIPVVVILAPLPWGEWASRLHESLYAKDIKVGLSLSDGLWLEGEQQSQQLQRSAFTDVQAMQLDSRLQAMVIANNGRAWLQSGLPLDQVDLVISDKSTDPQVLAMLKVAGQPTCCRVNQLLKSSSVSGPQSSQPLAKMVAEHINTLIKI